MEGERDRQHWKIELIASENYTFAAVMEAQGSWLTNKYAEGLPGKRYYGGCEFVDVVERLAQERALALFPGAEHVNVQPHAGAQANLAAYFAVLDPGDPVMGLNLSHGGHLTHGMALNFSGRLYEIHPYGVDRITERFDYDEIERLAREVRPKMIVAGATAYSRIIDFERLGRDRPLRGRAAVRGHGPHRRARRRRPAPDAVRARRHRHDDHAQDPARTPRRPDLQPARVPGGHRPEPVPAGQDDARRRDRPRRVPGPPGRPADARDRRQGGRAAPRRDRRLPDATSGARSRTRGSSRRPRADRAPA